MTRRTTLAIVVLAPWLAPPVGPVRAQDKDAAVPASPVPSAPAARLAGYARLQMFAGNWTLEGREGRYLEKCDWFEGRFHMVCHTESKRADGTVSKSISILGYLPEEDAYTYYGIGSTGRNETLRGAFTGTTLGFRGEARDAGKLVKNHVTITPAANGDFLLASEISIDGGPWTSDGVVQYKRVR